MGTHVPQAMVTVVGPVRFAAGPTAEHEYPAGADVTVRFCRETVTGNVYTELALAGEKVALWPEYVSRTATAPGTRQDSKSGVKVSGKM